MTGETGRTGFSGWIGAWTAGEMFHVKHCQLAVRG